MPDSTIIAPGENAPALRILAASALRASLGACATAAHAACGLGFSIEWGTSGAIEQRIRAGEMFDLVASARGALERLAADGLCRNEILSIGASKLALGIREGDRAPDISTLEKFRETLISARTISRGDPAGGGTAGNHLVKVFALMGVSDIVGAKSILRAGGFAVMTEVVMGHADFGLTQSTEIPAVKGALIGGYLPDDVQMDTIYAIAPCANAAAQSARFLDYLGSDAGQRTFAAAGFAPSP